MSTCLRATSAQASSSPQPSSSAFLLFIFCITSASRSCNKPFLLVACPLTQFHSLLDPAYGEIGPQTCVGMTGGWSSYSWVAGIVLTSVMLVFLLDFAAERYVEIKYGYANKYSDVEGIITGDGQSHPALQSSDQNDLQPTPELAPK